MYENSFERLNALAAINSASTYLEIGVAKGNTFTQVNVPYKVAVDPRFAFNVNEYANQRTIFHEVPSDTFFSKLASEYGAFDLIFLDGLHTFEQTFRDFCASMGHAHANTIWLIDDVYPTGWLAANPSLEFTRRLRNLLRINDSRWMGDVYKVVFAIHDFFPQFSYATLAGRGQTVVWRETREDFAPKWNSLAKISDINYREFLKFRNSYMFIKETTRVFKNIAETRTD